MSAVDIACDLIKKFEGCRLDAYKDLGGKWTIGWGKTSGVHEGMIITQKEADDALMNYVSSMACFLEFLPTDLNNNQTAAIYSLVYNIGTFRFDDSALLKKLRVGDRASAAEEFLRWDHIDGKEITGLLARRKAEMELFLTPC